MTPSGRSTIRDVVSGAAFMVLLAAVLAGSGEERNHYHYMRGYMTALGDVMRGEQKGA